MSGRSIATHLALHVREHGRRGAGVVQQVQTRRARKRRRVFDSTTRNHGRRASHFADQLRPALLCMYYLFASGPPGAMGVSFAPRNPIVTILSKSLFLILSSRKLQGHPGSLDSSSFPPFSGTCDPTSAPSALVPGGSYPLQFRIICKLWIFRIILVKGIIPHCRPEIITFEPQKKLKSSYSRTHGHNLQLPVHGRILPAATCQILALIESVRSGASSFTNIPRI